MVAELGSTRPMADEAKMLTHQIAGDTDAIEDKDQLSNTDARVERIVEKIIDDHVLRVTDNVVQGVKRSAQERVQSYTVEHIIDVPVTRRRVFIIDDCDELIPEWLNFVKGVVDSEDLPLDISGETLLRNKILRVIRKNYVTKYLEILAEIAELKDDYKKFYEQYGKCRNDEDSTVGVKTAELLMFNTSEPGDDQNSFEEFVDSMKERQNDMYYFTGENIAVVSASPFEENLRKHGHEMLHVADPMDEYAVHQPKEFDETKITGESIAAVFSRKKGHEVLYVADPVDDYAMQLLEEFEMELKPTMKEGYDEKNKLEELKDSDSLELFKDEDTSPATDTMNHASAIADPTDQLTGTGNG